MQGYKELFDPVLVDLLSKELEAQFPSFTEVDTSLSTETSSVEGFLDFGNRTIDIQRGYKNGQFEGDTIFYENCYPILFIHYSAGVAQSIKLVIPGQVKVYDYADSGERIEGFIDEKGNMACGSFYNEWNQLEYCGVNVGNKHFGFGIEYHNSSAREIIHHIGFFFNGKYDGIGIEYDQNGSLYRSGVWSEGVYISKQLVINHEIGFNEIHETVIELQVEPTAMIILNISEAIQQAKCLKRLELHNNSLCQLTSFSLSGMKDLEEIWIGDDVMTGGPLTRDEGNSDIVNRFCLESLPSLRSLRVGCRSLYRCQDMIIHDCDKLERIEIGRMQQIDERNCGSFDWCRSFLLSELPSLQSIVIGDSCFRSLQTAMIWNLPNLTSCSFGVASMCGSTAYTAVFVNLDSLQDFTSEHDSWCRVSSIYEYNVNPEVHCHFDTTAFISLKYHNCLLENPFFDTPDSKDIALPSCSTEVKSSLDFSHLHYKYTKIYSTLIMGRSFLELQAMSHRYHLRIHDNSLINLTNIDWGIFTNLKTLKIGSNSLRNLDSFIVENQALLESVKVYYSVGWDCVRQELLERRIQEFDLEKRFTNKKFRLGHCPMLRTISIGCNCFCDYEEFQLEDLPVLEALSIGEGKLGQYSFALVHELAIEGFTHLESVHIKNSFCCTPAVYITENPCLKTIVMDHSLIGDESIEGDMRIENNPMLETFVATGDALHFTSVVVLDNLPKLRVFDFPVREDSSYSIYYNNLQQEVELELIQRYYHNSINVIKIDNEWSVC